MLQNSRQSLTLTSETVLHFIERKKEDDEQFYQRAEGPEEEEEAWL